jgi:hypothetical protein
MLAPLADLWQRQASEPDPAEDRRAAYRPQLPSLRAAGRPASRRLQPAELTSLPDAIVHSAWAWLITLGPVSQASQRLPAGTAPQGQDDHPGLRLIKARCCPCAPPRQRSDSDLREERHRVPGDLFGVGDGLRPGWPLMPALPAPVP